MNRQFLIAPLAMALALSGCDNFLTEKPKSFLTTDDFYTTVADARAAVLSTYQSLNADYVNDWGWMMVVEGMSDDANAHPADQNPEAQHPGQLAWDPSNIFMVPFWENSTGMIYRANLAMDRLPASPLSAAEKATSVAELKFLRGWIMLEQEKRYGGVPIYATLADHENAQPVRATREAVDAQIIKDLTEAEAGLPATRPGIEWGRATKGAAQMALADIYNWRSSRYGSGEWQKASDWAKKVIDSGQYRLLDDQVQVFAPNNKGNAELIFVHTSTGVDSRSSSSVIAAHYPRELTPGGGWGVVTPTKWSYESFPKGDYRITSSFRFAACNLNRTQCFDPLPMGSQPYKFRPSDQTVDVRADIDFPLYRYAETLLFYAEAQNELGNTATAIDYVNTVRARARKGTGNESRAEPANLPTGMSKIAARDAVFTERHHELIWEVKRWWDIVRRDSEEPGYLVTSLTSHDPIATQRGPVQIFRKLWPIPTREIEVSRGSLTQNPGY